MSVQRWKPNKATERYWSEGMRFDADGAYVTYADHAEALAESEQRVRDGYDDRLGNFYAAAFADGKRSALEDMQAIDSEWSRGYADALTAAREAVEATPHHDLCSIKRNYPCNCLRGRQLEALDALAAGQAPAAPLGEEA